MSRNENTAFARIVSAANATVNAVMEPLENRQLMAGDSTFVTSLPFTLEFDSARGGMTDKNGLGTGFTWVQPNKLGNEYIPANINLNTAQGILSITTTGTSAAGGPYDADNTLTNSLQTQFNASSGSFTIRTRLVGPLGFIDKPSEQGGIIFGPDQDNYVKLVAVAQPGGTFLQFIDEQKNGTSFVHQVSSSASLVNIGSFANINTLDLEMVGDATTGKLQAFYRINGGSLQKLTQEITLSGASKANFFSSVGRAGLIAMHKNDAGAMTIGFDRFEIAPGNPATNRPSVTATRPALGATGVARDTFIAADVSLPTSGHGVDASTLTNSSVKLYRTSDHALVSGHLNTTGGGDAIVFQPTGLLDANTSYTFEINDLVKDTGGSAFVPYVMTFTTGTASTPADPRIAFEKIALTTTTGVQYSGLTMGPDGKLYAATSEGLIHRFTIKPDGTLGAPEVISTVQLNNGGKRFTTGIVFDPSSTANNLILWVSHNYAEVENAPDWTGKISRLSGQNLDTYQDYITQLPRSIRDHMTNQMVFGPDGKLYFSQASQSAMGAPDNAWGLRPEHLLNAAILQVDTGAITARIAAGQGPLDVRTEGVTNPYDPFAAGAPLKIYATGVRNAYDLVWASNGHLYTPTNGSAAGGATPSYAGGTFSGPRIDSGANGPFTSGAIAGIGNVKQTEDDFLHDVVQGGYYGHPNPTRGEFIQDGGNPTAGVDYEEFTQYPVGTQPDRNYRGAAYVFGKNYSPNGVIEYKSDAFNGLLKGKLLVVRYSGGDDIVALDINADGSVKGMQSGFAGLGGLVDPLDLVADNVTGNIYVSEYGAGKITLLRPIAAGAHAEVEKPTYFFNDVRGGSNSPTQKVVIKNTGTDTLNITSLVLGGANANQFVIVSKPNIPVSIPVGGSVEIGVAFAAGSTTTLGIKTAQLQITTNDPNRATLNVDLRGLATQGEGGQNEPSFQRILDLFQLPINTGDINPSNTNLYSNAEPLSSVNDELNIQRFVKAGAGPVTFETLASMGGASTPVSRLGYYTPGTPTSLTELYTIAKADAQSVHPTPVGNTSFDPGTNPFGLYTVWPIFNNRIAYSEDSLNTTENTIANRKKMHAYAMKNPDGSVVPNAYVVTFEDFVNDSTGGYDSNDLVVIVRNVMPAPAGAEIGLQNMDGAPSNDRMIFSRIQVQPPLPVKQADGTFVQPPNNVVHDRGVMRIFNSGSQDLVVSNIQITGAFALAAGTPTSFTVAPDAQVDVTVIFNAQSGGVQEGSLKVFSNDADEPVSTMQLAGMWQSYSEQGPGGAVTEHPLSEFFRLFGYSTKAVNAGQNLSNGGKNEAVGDEVLSAYWQAADPTAPVKVTQLAAYHTQGNTEQIKTFLKSNPNSQTTLFTHEGLMGQSILPTLQGSTTALAQANLPAAVANTVFGFKVSSMWTDDSLTNQKDPVTGLSHFIRMYPAKDASGAVIPNQWLLAMDYYGINYDYQDNIYLITNVRPANPAAPTGVAAETAAGGLRVSWALNTEPTATGYNVYRSSSATGTFIKVNSGPVKATEFIDSTAPANATSYYKVTAADDWGGESTQSIVVSAARGADDVAPATPTGFGATSRIDGVLLGWFSNVEPDLAGYKVYRATAIDGTFTALNGGAALSVNELLDSDVVDGTTYYYKISAIDAQGNESAQSAAITGKRLPPPDTTAPDAPTGIGATGIQSGILVTWSANAETDVSGYRVFRASSLNGTYTQLNAGLVNGTAYTDTTAATATPYYYRIVAVDNAGNSSTASASATASRPLPDPIRISAAATQTYVDSQGRSWSADNSFSGGTASNNAYDVLGTTDDPLYYTRRSGNFNYNIAMPDGAYKVNLLFVDSTYTAAGKRKFDVFAENKQIMDDFDVVKAAGAGKTAVSRAFNLNVTGGELNLKFVNVLDNALVSAIEIIPIGDTVAPTVPKKPTVAGSQTGVKLDWNDNLESDLAGYNVYRSSDVDGPYTKINSDTVTISEFVDGNAPSGTTSYYRITAVDVWGNESSPVSITGNRPVDVTPPAIPTGLTGTGSLTGVALDWSDNTEADLAGYNVYRQDATTGDYVKLNASPLTVSAYKDATAASDATSNYRVTAVDLLGNESAFAETSAYRPPAPTSGTGLKAEYYDNSNFTGLKLTRTDASVNFDWGTGSPDASMGVDTFSVRWTGQIQALETNTYTFTFHADDGVRMWVNGVLVIDKFVNAGTVKDHVSTPVQLTAGQKVDIKIEYFENTGNASAQLYWQSSTMAKQLVPTAALYPAS